MEWPPYMPYQPITVGPPYKLERAEAKAAFVHKMAHKSERAAQLARLVEANGFGLGTSDEALDRLDDFYRTNVERSATDPERMMNIWYAVAFDIALHLGDVLIERAPTLRWEFFRWGKTTEPGMNISYHEPVIMGFNVENPEYNRNFMWDVPAYGLRAMDGEVESAGFFTSIINRDVSEA